jgi:hypothetical protein
VVIVDAVGGEVECDLLGMSGFSGLRSFIQDLAQHWQDDPILCLANFDYIS